MDDERSSAASRGSRSSHVVDGSSKHGGGANRGRRLGSKPEREKPRKLCRSGEISTRSEEWNLDQRSLWSLTTVNGGLVVDGGAGDGGWRVGMLVAGHWPAFAGEDATWRAAQQLSGGRNGDGSRLLRSFW